MENGNGIKATLAIKSLEEITKAWGDWMSKKYPKGGGVKYTESTHYSKQSSLNDYHRYQTNVDSSELSYDPFAPNPKPGSISSIKTNFNNDASLQQSLTYKQSASTTQSFNWSVTEALKLGLKVSVKAGVPLVAEVTSEFSTELNLSSTQGASSTESQSWEVMQPVLCPPHSHVTAQLIVNTAQYDIKWTADTLLDGYVAIWFKNRFFMDGRSTDHHLYFFRIGSVINDCVKNNIIDTRGYKKVSGWNAIATSNGVFYGGQGTEMTVNVHETPLKSDNTIDETKSSSEYGILLDKSGENILVSED